MPLIGREDAEKQLLTALNALVGGVGDCLVVAGPAGIGKSRMLAEAQVWAARLGLAVAVGRASELDRIAPLTTLLVALNGCEPPILAEGDLSGLGQREEERFWLVDKLATLLEAYSRIRPLMVMLDDVQWADELTALALRILVPTLRTSPVLWLLARRPLPAGSPTRQALDWLMADGARELPLGPLREPEVSQLCATVLDALPDESLLTLIKGSGGNPFLLETLLTTLRASGGIRVKDGIATATDGSLPMDFLAAVDQRLRDLSPPARRLLDAGSVLGRPFTLSEAAGMLDGQAVKLLDPAGEAVEAAMLVGTGNAFAFRHDLIREAIYGALPGPVQQALHRAAASALQAEGRSAPEVAEHLIRGAGPPGNMQALGIVREAVAQVAPGAPGAAADLILGYLGSCSERVPGQARLMVDAVGLLASAGRLAQARQLGESALRLGLDAPTEAAALLGLAEALKHAGRDHAAIGYTNRALGLADVPATERARLLAIQAHAKLLTNDVTGADAAGTQAEELGTAVGEYSAVVFALGARCVAAYARGSLDDALGFADRGVSLAEEAGGKARHRHPLLWRGMVLTAMDRMQEAAEVFEADSMAAEQLGTAWSRPLWHHLHADLLLAVGRLADAKAEAEAGLRIAGRFGTAGVTPALLATLAQIALRRDQPEAALDYLHRAQRHVHDGIGVITEEMTWKLALHQDATGRPDQARATLATLYAAFPDRLYLIMQEPSAGPQLVRMALRAGDRDRADAAAAATRMAAQRNPGNASLAGAADQAEGLLRGEPGILHAAVSSFRASPRPYSRACALEDAGVADQVSGDRDAAIELLKQALAEYRQAGAKRDARRVQQRLRRLGSRTDTTRGKRPKTGWASLTRSELKVARLVAEGHTNRQIADRLVLSPHTVDTHVRHAFTKLGVSSRVALTRLALAEHEDQSADEAHETP